jgi:uncharacterized membrane protein
MASPEDMWLSLWTRFKQDLKNDLIAGLLVVIPLATTIWLTATVSRWVIAFLTRIPKQFDPFSDLNPFVGDLLNLGIGFSVPLLGILLIGLMARNIAGRWLLDFGERTLESIPLAGSVYSTLKQLLGTLISSNSKFRRVVMLEYPRKGVWAIAFVTGTLPLDFQVGLPEGPLLSVFIPTTPNPTTGWYGIVPEAEVVNSPMAVEDAFKLLISGGIVMPPPKPVLEPNPVMESEMAGDPIVESREPVMPEV